MVRNLASRKACRHRVGCPVTSSRQKQTHAAGLSMRLTHVFEGVGERHSEGLRGRVDFGQLPALAATETNWSCDSKSAPPSSPCTASPPPSPAGSARQRKIETSPHIRLKEDGRAGLRLMDYNGIMPQS